MTIKTNEYWIDEPFEQIALKIKIDTRQVKFRIFNAFEKSFEMYPRPWIGEINAGKKTFKLFRTKGSDNTSDLSVVGRYTTRGAKPVVVVKHRIHFTVIFGAVGLLLFAISAFYLLQQKGIIVPPAVQAIAFSLVILFYIYTIAKDLRQDEKQLEKTLTRVLVSEEDDEEVDVEDDDEDYES
jgi:choline-glycine betaine transporter